MGEKELNQKIKYLLLIINLKKKKIKNIYFYVKCKHAISNKAIKSQQRDNDISTCVQV